MVKIKLRNGEPSENPYVYKCEMECFGRSIEFGISYREASELGKMGRKVTTQLQNFRMGLRTMQRKIRERREARNNSSKTKHSSDDQTLNAAGRI